MAVRRVVVVGAGMVGLSTAWFLQEHDLEVTVLDRTGVAADASWGNAGWLAPALTLPLPEPSVLRYGLRSVLTPSSPVYVPFTTDLRLRYQVARRWIASFGIDNLNNEKYWNFHPYPQRTYIAELKFDL